MTSEGDEAGDRTPGALRFRLSVRAALVAAALVILIAVHGRILQLVLAHLTVSGACVSGVIALMALTHLGVLGSAYAIRHRRQNGR